VVTPDVPVSDMITSNDIYQFLRENKRYYVSEDDCKFIIKYYDSDNDGCINYVDFNFIVLVNDNIELRAGQTQKNN
jgi:Ca2+-binding EF-hand superfamily protein